MVAPDDGLMFAPLGGVGEIGMNLSIYGLGEARRRQWLAVDLGVSFAGVSVDTLFAIARPLPAATHVLARSHTGYTTNLPLGDVTAGKSWVVWEFEGEPLSPDHGGPARLLVPHLYLWKSAKWVRGLEAIPANRAGFWESLGYHLYGDPWKEQRYWGD